LSFLAVASASQLFTRRSAADRTDRLEHSKRSVRSTGRFGDGESSVTYKVRANRFCSSRIDLSA
jgi:hypothetical protein